MAGTATTLKLMASGRRMLVGIASVLFLGATGTAAPALTEGAVPLAARGNERAPALAAHPVGADVAVLADKLERLGNHLWSTRHAKGRSGIPPLAVAVAAALAVNVIGRRSPLLRAVPRVVADPLSGIDCRAPPSLQLTGC